MGTMRVARLLLASASPFDVKCFRLDSDPPTAGEERSWSLPGAPRAGGETRTERELERELLSFAPDLLHVYGRGVVPHRLVAALPWLADRRLGTSRPLLGRRPGPQAKVLIEEIAEPVADDYFAPPAPLANGRGRRVGSIRQSGRTASHRDLVEARIRRFRDDVQWELFDTSPSVAEMRTLDLWVDLADDENELDGLVGEALALGLPVVAARTAVNRRRTADGRAAALCPKGDHNEMAHAIVTMLFKPERAAPILEAAEGLRAQFRKDARRAALLRSYAEVLG